MKSRSTPRTGTKSTSRVSATRALKGAPRKAAKAVARVVKKVAAAASPKKRGTAKRSTAKGGAAKGGASKGGAAKRTAAKRAPAKHAPAKRATAKRATAKRAAPVNDRERVRALLEDFSTVMLVTTEGQGEGATLRARPMAVAQLDEDCTMTFMTGLDTTKVDEARQSGSGHVVAQGRTTFLSLSGRTEVVRDRARIEAAWKPGDKVWFPKGKDDPNLCLLVFRPESAEIWDVSGTKGLQYLFEAAKALVTGTRPEHDDKEQHDLVDLRTAS